MSTIIKDINDALKTCVATIAGAEYRELDYVFEVEKNNYYGNKSRYGVRPVDGFTVDTITNHVTIDQNFEVILLSDYVNKDDDYNQRDVLFNLYGIHTEIWKSAYNRKLGIPNIVLSVPIINISEPEFDEENHIAIQRAQLLIRYREAFANC